MEQEPEPIVPFETLGWNSSWTEKFEPFRRQDFDLGRIAVQDKHGYIVFTAQGELPAQISGKLLHEFPDRTQLPKVGDWVALLIVPLENKAVIHHVLPRQTKLARKSVGKDLEEQVLVTNVDIAFIVQALDRTFNARLLERHLLMVLDGGIKPVVVLNKSDLCDNVLQMMSEAEKAAADAPVLAVSGKTGRAIDALTQLIRPGETVVFLGPSGVGKSTLINQIYGEEIQATMEVREKDAKGRHTTTWRELIVLPSGGLVIDTPGMREFHIWLAGEGIHEAFPDIEQLSLKCHFTNCTHTAEKKCAVLDAVARGELDQERFDNFLKLKRELEFLDKAQTGQIRPGQERHVKFARRIARRRKTGR
jgi:ribosome biogenesis GTPase